MPLKPEDVKVGDILLNRHNQEREVIHVAETGVLLKIIDQLKITDESPVLELFIKDLTYYKKKKVKRIETFYVNLYSNGPTELPHPEMFSTAREAKSWSSGESIVVAHPVVIEWEE